MPAQPILDDPPTSIHPSQPYQPGPGPGGGRSHGRLMLAVGLLGLLALLGAIGVALWLTVFATDSGGTRVYRTQVNTAMRGVVTANTSTSAALARLTSGKPTSAQREVSRAQTATASARGAINALAVPEGEEQLASNARQTLSREAAYLSAVEATLADPGAPGPERAQTLAGNLTDALDVLAPTSADWSQSVGGSDNLTAWAGRNRELARRRARRNRAKRQVAPSTPDAPRASSAPAVASGTDCGGGLRAGPNTSCAFAVNVRDAWGEAPGTANTVQVYSPTTGQTYTMSCAPAGSGISCSGGNSASVSF